MIEGKPARLRLWDKLRALELLGKNLKLFKEQIDIGGTVKLEDLVNSSLDPEKKSIVSEGEGGTPALTRAPEISTP